MRDILRGLGELTRAYMLRSLRSKTALFWNFAFPLFWLFLFAYVIGDGTSRGVTYLMPGLFTITIVAISFAGVSYRLISEREQGILRRYRATPVRALTIVLANSVTSLAVLAMSLLLLGAVAWLLFGIRIATTPLDLAVVLLFGALAFVPLGLVVGSVSPSQKATPAIANAIFFPLVFVSGAAIPFSLLPGWIQEVGRFVPATYLVEALQGVMVRGESVWSMRDPTLVLVATAAVGAAISALVFRWESREPVSRRRVALAAGLAAVLCVGTARLSPPLDIAREPGPFGERFEEQLRR